MALSKSTGKPRGDGVEARGAFRAVSSRILESATSDAGRREFLDQILNLLLDYSGCDIINLVLRYRGRHLRCRVQQRPSTSFEFIESRLPSDHETSLAWSDGSQPGLESLCRQIAQKRIETSQAWFTPAGSFWTGDISLCRPLNSIDRTDPDQPGIALGPQIQSWALIPVDVGDQCLGLMTFESQAATFFIRRKIDLLEQSVQAFGLALAHRRLRSELGERVKEVTCLYNLAKLVAHPDVSLDDILREAVGFLPAATLFPEVAAARISLDDISHSTAEFDRAVTLLSSEIAIGDKHRGLVEVGYTVRKPDLDEGPFLLEERRLIDAVASEIGKVVEQKRVQSEKTQLQEQLRHADRLATIGQLAAGVAHELNEPLASILGFGQLTLKSDDLGVQTRQDIGKIVAASLHAREVIRKLLVFARETETDRRVLNLSDVVRSGLYFLESRCTQAGIELTSRLSDDLPNFLADQSQLIQVLTNLVVNAIQAMPQGGALTVASACEAESILLTVSDTGLGMTDETREKMFNPFYTTKADDLGTGLGLSVVHGIVESMGGTIQVDSTVGYGTTFTVRFPICPEKSEDTALNG